MFNHGSRESISSKATRLLRSAVVALPIAALCVWFQWWVIDSDVFGWTHWDGLQYLFWFVPGFNAGLLGVALLIGWAASATLKQHDALRRTVFLVAWGMGISPALLVGAVMLFYLMNPPS